MSIPEPPPAPCTPGQALRRGCWVKWIAGASNQDLTAIEDLAGIYTLAGVHCLDLAADPAVVSAARRGIAWAVERGAIRPWLMVSLSDGVDPHFRKAWFDPDRCPVDCPRPCQRVCPAAAIPAPGEGPAAVVESRCYGCGRCLPACPLGLIEERSRVLEAAAVPALLAGIVPDAVELHTRPGRGEAFAARLSQLLGSGVPLLLLSVSCGLEAAPSERCGARTGEDRRALAAELWQRYAAVRRSGYRPLWQLDGRPMRGDVGEGTAHAAVQLFAALAPFAPPGPLQLAGGTNHRSLELVERLEARRGGGGARVAGVAFGGCARSLIQPLLLQAEQRQRRLLDDPELWPAALTLARGLVDPWLRRLPQRPSG